MTDAQPTPAFELPEATGVHLDVCGQDHGLIRNDGEPDDEYRARLMVFIDSRRAPKDREWAR